MLCVLGPHLCVGAGMASVCVWWKCRVTVHDVRWAMPLSRGDCAEGQILRLNLLFGTGKCSERLILMQKSKFGYLSVAILAQAR